MAERPRILIVEDEQIIAADLEHTLAALGYAISGSVDSGEAAIEMAMTTRPDLVLMDIDLQGSVNAFIAADEIHRQYRIPVVFLTASSNETLVTKARAAGAYGYLLKPYRDQELNAAIALALQQHGYSLDLFSKYQRLQTMLANLSDAIVVTDNNGRVRYLNAVAEVLTGWTVHDAAGRSVDDIFPVESFDGQPVPVCQLRKALTTLKPVGRERFILCQRDGHRIPIEDSASPILEGDVIIGAVSIFRDITDRLARERAVEALKDHLAEQVSSTKAALGQTRAELRALSGHLIRAQEEERRAIARELHDDFGQRTALIDMQATRALDLVSNENSELRELLTKMRDQVAEISVGLRSVSHRLHPSVLTDLGLVSALRDLVDNFRKSGGELAAEFPAVSPQLPLESATAIYRITQEALRNSMKHAPGASVKLSLVTKRDTVEVTIEDAGPGFNLSRAKLSGGLGLVSMEERARLVGGSILFTTAPGKGVIVALRVPRGTT